nr:kelch-like protein 24 isoform X1 [Ciona intestinalis]|eukprot:XP_002121338.1 kelch-like protein 24 isoform X1 [Ciona intestinalis]
MSSCSQFVFPLQVALNLREMNLMREQSLLTDVTITAEDREFECHRVVLASSCPYFKAMFTYDLRESTERKVTLHGIEATSFAQILNFAYTGTCMLSKQNAADIFVASDLFGILSLRNAAENFLKKCVDFSNCLQILRLSSMYSCPEVTKIAKEFARQNFIDVTQQNEFLQLTIDDVIDYLNDDDINVAREDLVFDAAIRWLRHQPNPTNLTQRVLESVRLPFVRPEYLKIQSTMEVLLNDNAQCLQKISEAISYHHSDSNCGTFLNKQRKPRKRTSREVVMVFGGETRAGSTHEASNDVSYYDPMTSRWDSISILPGAVSAEAFSVVSLGYEIYLTGGTVNGKATNKVTVFYTYLNKWVKLSNMLVPRYHHTCTAIGDMIYAVGGTNGSRCLDDVERYRSDVDKWEKIEKLVHAIKCPAVATHKEKLYVFGGFTDSYVISQSIQVYTIPDKTWTIISSSMIDYTCAHAAPINSKIFLLGGGSKIVKIYDTETDQVSRVSDMLEKRDNCGVTVVGGKIFVTGGVSESSGPSLMTSECYCPLRNKWERIPEMPRPLHRHGSVSMRIPIYQRTDRVSPRTPRTMTSSEEVTSPGIT